MEHIERPSKLQKRDHASGNEVAVFAAPDATDSNGNGTATDLPDVLPASHEPEVEASAKIIVDEKDAKADAASSNNAEPPMSKSAIKKARKLAEWEAGREDRKVKRKEKIKASKEAKREAIQAAIAADPSYAEKHKAQVKQKMDQKSSAVHVPVTVVFDCNFDDKMLDYELKSLAGQLTRCYSDTRNSSMKPHLAVASFGGKLKERFEGILDNHHKNWKGVRFLEEDFVQVAEKAKEWMKEKDGGKLAGPLLEKSQSASGKASGEGTDGEKVEGEGESGTEGEVIYLSSEGDETLHELKPNGVYIIGGLVDKNRHKGICHQRAKERGVRTAKLPIGDFLEMSSRKVLAVNHVNQIMLKWLECGDWGEAFLDVMPKRKGGLLRKESEDAEGDGDESTVPAESKEEDVPGAKATETSEAVPEAGHESSLGKAS